MVQSVRQIFIFSGIESEMPMLEVCLPVIHMAISQQTVVSTRFFQAHFGTQHSTRLALNSLLLVVLTVFLACSVSPYLMVDVMLGLDWQSGLLDWYSHGLGHRHSDNLDVAALLHAPLPPPTLTHPIASISEPLALSDSNTMFSLSHFTSSLPGRTPLGRVIPSAPAPCSLSTSSYCVIPNRYIKDASGIILLCTCMDHNPATFQFWYYVISV
ncbi:hypothetical protein B0H11DRAFT_1912884 [Mycena galericulata]|nr:hypothetical protein B0H11DRAFT_1912884 [Mycena galericulata]